VQRNENHGAARTDVGTLRWSTGDDRALEEEEAVKLHAQVMGLFFVGEMSWQSVFSFVGVKFGLILVLGSMIEPVQRLYCFIYSNQKR
jgi:hypothetical protein